MDIKKEHIASKKKVGTLSGKDVTEIVTTGGLHIVVTTTNKGLDILGAGPHRGVARFIAEKKAPNVSWTELSKSDHIDVSLFGDLVDKYVELTNRLRALSGGE